MKLTVATPLLRHLPLSAFFILSAAISQAQISYRGFYTGTLSTGGHIGFYAESNGEATVVVIDPASQTFGASGTLTVGSNGQLSGTYSIATITGEISPNGVATGTVAPLGITFTAQRAPTTGSTLGFAGFYQGWDFDPNNIMLSVGVMVSADGQFFIYVQNGPNVTDAGYGTIDSRGIFSFTDAYGSTAPGSVITTAAGLCWNGRYTKPGLGGYSFVAGRRDSANRFVNISTRALVGTGAANALTAGFVITGGAKTVLIRGVGPTLANFGVTGFLANPQLTVYSGSVAIASNSFWSLNSNYNDLVTATAQVGAFALTFGSADTALLLRLEPGAYTAAVSAPGTSTGIALVEVWEVE